MENTTCTHAFKTNAGLFACVKPQGHDMGHLTYINGMKHGWAEKPKYADWFQKEYNWGVEDARYRAKVLGAFDEGLPRYKAKVLADLEPKTTVQLNLTDLKTIAYYMAEEEDADPTKAKIDAALKEML